MDQSDRSLCDAVTSRQSNAQSILYVSGVSTVNILSALALKRTLQQSSIIIYRYYYHSTSSMITSRFQEFTFKWACSSAAREGGGAEHYQRFVALSGLFEIIDWMSTYNRASRCYSATIIFVLPKCCSLKILWKIHWNHLICMCVRYAARTFKSNHYFILVQCDAFNLKPATPYLWHVAAFSCQQSSSRTNYIWKHS